MADHRRNPASAVPWYCVVLDRLGILALLAATASLAAPLVFPALVRDAVRLDLFALSFVAAVTAFVLARVLELGRFAQDRLGAGAPAQGAGGSQPHSTQSGRPAVPAR